MCLHSLGSPWISFGDRTGQLQRLFGNCIVIVQKSYDPPVMSMRAPCDYLKSLRSFWGPYDYPNSCGVLMLRDHAINLLCIDGLEIFFKFVIVRS